jgi:hypothetical protein
MIINRYKKIKIKKNKKIWIIIHLNSLNQLLIKLIKIVFNRYQFMRANLKIIKN